MFEKVTAHYETGPGMEPIHLFTVLYALRDGLPRTINDLCNVNTLFVRTDDSALRDVLRRRIANQLTRADRNLLIEKAAGTDGQKNSYTITGRGQQFISAGLASRVAFLKQNPSATMTMACAQVALDVTVNTGDVKKRSRQCKEDGPRTKVTPVTAVQSNPLAQAWWPMPPAHASLPAGQTHAER